MKRPGPYICVDVHYFDDERVALCPPLAVVLHLRCMCYAAAELTDGRVPGIIMKRLMRVVGARKRDLDRLLEVGLVEKLGNAPGSRMGEDYYLPAYLKWNPSKADLEAEREAARRRQQEKRERDELRNHLRAV